jgi:para-aminobenzoate synthetase component 1
VCRPGTVEVVTARRLERYATVFQAVAVVRGRLRGDAAGVDLVAAAFPPGSVTGAPKVEAMKVIDALEGEARGPYCGAIGWLDDGGDLDLAVAIRTVCVAGSRVSYRVGGGVTLLSDPEAERVETLHKGAALARAIDEAGR